MVSQWRVCAGLTMDPQTLTLIIQLVREYYELWGRYPTAAELQRTLIGS